MTLAPLGDWHCKANRGGPTVPIQRGSARLADQWWGTHGTPMLVGKKATSLYPGPFVFRREKP